jgi:DNA-binding response OmpR family regulator
MKSSRRSSGGDEQSGAKPTRVLLLKDDTGFYAQTLTADGFEVIAAKTSQEALQKAVEIRPDVVLADLSLLMDGVALTERLKNDQRTTHIPVILISGANKAERDRAVRARTVADDYILEPSSRSILKARIYSILRSVKAPLESKEVIGDAGVRLDVHARTVSVKGRAVKLTRKEFDLLALFLTRKGRVLTIGRLLEDVWGYDAADYNDPRTIQTHVSSLRRKLGPGVGRRIWSVSGIGYRFD